MNRFLICKKTSKNRAFTMIEVMVALVILSVGLLGMAGMTMVIMRGNRGAEDLANATNICQQKIEELKDISWAQLGSVVSTDPNALNFGLTNADMIRENDLNSQGLTRAQLFTQQSSVAGSACNGVAVTAPACSSYLDKAGPYKYSRSFAVCNGQDYTMVGSVPTPPVASNANLLGTTPAYSAEPNCLADPATGFRPQALACESNDILTPGASSPEKMIKIICSWRTKEGRCSFVNFEALRMNNL